MTRFFLAGIALSLLALPTRADDQPRLNSSGTGVVTAEPDLGYLTLGVVTRHKQSAQAVSDNAGYMTSVYAALSELGIERKQIQTIDFSVTEDREIDETSRGRREVKVGFVVTNLVRITVTDLKKIGKVVDAVTAVGSNSIHQIEFSNTRSKELLSEARKRAVLESREKAHTICAALDLNLGTPILITEEHSRFLPRDSSRMLAMSAAPAGTEISGGSLEYKVTVTIAWALTPGRAAPKAHPTLGEPAPKPVKL